MGDISQGIHNKNSARFVPALSFDVLEDKVRNLSKTTCPSSCLKHNFLTPNIVQRRAKRAIVPLSVKESAIANCFFLVNWHVHVHACTSAQRINSRNLSGTNRASFSCVERLLGLGLVLCWLQQTILSLLPNTAERHSR